VHSNFSEFRDAMGDMATVSLPTVVACMPYWPVTVSHQEEQKEKLRVVYRQITLER
jgi:regulatory protein YycI of two-component signal transduction system YycFG